MQSGYEKLGFGDLKPLHITLIAPKMSLRPMDSEFKRLMTPSISLLVLSALTPKDYIVEIIDENVSPIQYTSSTDLVGITCNIDTFYGAAEISQQYRELGVKVILGGIYPSSCPDEALKVADSVCIGDAEGLWTTILEDAKNKTLKSTYQGDQEFPMDAIPRPDWDAIRSTPYLYTNIVTTSRGCPYNCDFCYNSCEYASKVYRRRPIENILQEIKALRTRQVLFVDDNFMGDKNWLRQFLEAIKPLKLTWHAAVSANIGKDIALLDQMASAGCKSLYIGFESINQSSVSSVGKRQNKIHEYSSTIAEIHKRGMMVNTSLVFGFDHDGPHVFQETLNWLIANKVETMTSHILTPYPGTTLHKRLQEEGRITDTNLLAYNTANVVFQPAGMSPTQLKEGYLKLYHDFYTIGNILRRRPVSKSSWLPYFLFNLFYRKYGKFTSSFGKIGLMSSMGKMARLLSYGIG